MLSRYHETVLLTILTSDLSIPKDLNDWAAATHAHWLYSVHGVEQSDVYAAVPVVAAFESGGTVARETLVWVVVMEELGRHADRDCDAVACYTFAYGRIGNSCT